MYLVSEEGWGHSVVYVLPNGYMSSYMYLPIEAKVTEVFGNVQSQAQFSRGEQGD